MMILGSGLLFWATLYCTVDSKDEAATAAAVAMETASCDPAVSNVNNWQTSDVAGWLQRNQLDHLQAW